MFRKQRYLVVIEPDTVRGNDIRTEKPDPVEVLDRAHASLLDAVLDLLFGLRNVDMDQQIRVSCKLCDPQKTLL